MTVFIYGRYTVLCRIIIVFIVYSSVPFGNLFGNFDLKILMERTTSFCRR